MRYKSLLRILLMVFVSVNIGFPQQYQTHQQLNDSWYYFDDNQRHQFDASPKKQQKIFLPLNENFPETAILQMFVRANTSIFIDGKIVGFASEPATISYSLDSLFLVSQTDGGQLTMMLFNPDHIVVKDTEIRRPVLQLEKETQIPARRKNTDFQNVLLILMVIMLIMFAYIKISHPDIWRIYMQGFPIISLKDQREAIYKIKFFEKGTLVIVLTYALLSATAVSGLFYLFGLSLTSSEYFQSSHVFLAIFKWSSLVLFLFALALVRYILVKLFTRLFDFKEASGIHFYSHIRISMAIAVLVLLVEFVLIFGFQRTLPDNWLERLIIILLLLRSLLISLRLMRISPYRLFHLFSYLCATEFVPAIFLVNIAFLT